MLLLLHVGTARVSIICGQLGLCIAGEVVCRCKCPWEVCSWLAEFEQCHAHSAVRGSHLYVPPQIAIYE